MKKKEQPTNTPESKDRPKRDKSQEELREALNKRFLGMEGIIKQAGEEFRNAFESGIFEAEKTNTLCQICNISTTW